MTITMAEKKLTVIEYNVCKKFSENMSKDLSMFIDKEHQAVSLQILEMT